MSKQSSQRDSIDVVLFNYIVDQCKKHLESYHFTEIITPIIAPIGLSEQLSNMNDNTEKSITLRQEIAISIAKTYVDNGETQVPWKAYTWGPIFKYWASQEKSYRQLHQISAELIGAVPVSYDVQMIAMFDRLFSRTLFINSYALMLNFLGCVADYENYRKLLKTFLESSKVTGLCETCKKMKEKNIYIFDCNNKQCLTMYEQAPRIIDNLCDQCTHDWQQIQEQLDLLAVTYILNSRLMPRLDYCNKTIFEFSIVDGNSQNTICFGGRSDTLISRLGGQDCSSIGGTINIEVLIQILELRKTMLPLPQAPSLSIIIPLGVEQHVLALLIADDLRSQGLCIDLFFEHDFLKTLLSRANKMGAAYCLLLGEDEQRLHMVTIKNMITGMEDRIHQSALHHYLVR